MIDVGLENVNERGAIYEADGGREYGRTNKRARWDDRR